MAGTTPSGRLTVLAVRGTLPAQVVARFRSKFPRVALKVVTVKDGVYVQRRLREGLQADLIAAATDGNAAQLARDRDLQPLSVDRLSAWPHLFPAVRRLGTDAQGRVFVAPVSIGEVGIVVRSRLRAPPHSFADLFAPRFKGRLIFPDNAAIAVQAAAMALGYDAGHDLGEREDERVRILLKGKRHWFRDVWDDPAAAGRMFASGRVDVTVATRSEMRIMMRAGTKLRFVPAREGRLVWLRGFGLARDAVDLDAAYAFLDLLMRPATQAALVDDYGDLLASRRAVDQLPAAVVSRRGLDAPAHFGRAVAIAPELDHIDWVQTWYAVKTGRSCCL